MIICISILSQCWVGLWDGSVRETRTLALALLLIRYIICSLFLRKIEGKSLRFTARPSILVDVNQRDVVADLGQKRGSFFHFIKLDLQWKLHSYLAFKHVGAINLYKSRAVSPTMVWCLGVNGCVMILRASDRRLVFGRPINRCNVFMFILRYWNGSLLPQNVCQGSEKKPHQWRGGKKRNA